MSTRPRNAHRIYNIVDLFGNELSVNIPHNKKPKVDLFNDYDAFVSKFEAKKTTDDCYTPEEVMDVVIKYVNEKYPLTGKQIIRPFYPGKDFESIEYPEDCVVIDNPPFSIITKICKYYIANNVKFFLFCPHLTAFGANIDCTHIIASADITYENGATIKTSFVSNLFGDAKIIGDSDLHQRLKEIQQRNKANLPRYEYPKHVVTVSRIAYLVEKGISVSFGEKDLQFVRRLDAQAPYGKAIFGAGFIASDEVAKKLADAKIAADAATQKDNNVIRWCMSEREMDIVRSLG